jgi:predicted Fe-Mo cluster-binding NifX family protein
MKIAVVTDDGQTISMHFGRATHYLVCTVEDGKITAKEMVEKVGHHHGHEHGDSHEHGADVDHKHTSMIEPVADCEAILVRGMGRGAYLAIEEAHIKPVVTDIANADDAVQAYLDGTIVDHTEKLH